MDINVYVVIKDPDFQECYDSIWPTAETAREYVVACERKYRVEDSRHQYDHDIFKTGRWETNADGVDVWGYPGSGNTYGIIAEELTLSDDDAAPDIRCTICGGIVLCTDGDWWHEKDAQDLDHDASPPDEDDQQ